LKGKTRKLDAQAREVNLPKVMNMEIRVLVIFKMMLLICHLKTRRRRMDRA
jgi:hypothetical protein